MPPKLRASLYRVKLYGCTWVTRRAGGGYENVEEAIEDQGSKWSAGTIEELRSVAWRSTVDFAVDTWVAMGRQIERARRSGKPIGAPLAEEDDTPPAGRG